MFFRNLYIQSDGWLYFVQTFGMLLTYIIVNQPLGSVSKCIGKPQVRPSCAYKPASEMVLLIMI